MIGDAAVGQHTHDEFTLRRLQNEHEAAGRTLALERVDRLGGNVY